MKKRSCIYVSFITSVVLAAMLPFTAYAEEIEIIPEDAIVLEGEENSPSNIDVMGEIPSKYPRDMSELPPLRVQRRAGTWPSFATLAAGEMDLITDGNASGASIDLSEMHTAYFSRFFNLGTVDPLGGTAGDTCSYNGYDYTLEDSVKSRGSERALLTMATWSGPVDQSDVMEELYADENTRLDPADQYKSRYHLQGYYKLNKNNIEDIKKNIIKHGAVTSCFSAFTTYYSASNNTYYCPYGGSLTNHGTAIVGWDDSFKKESFDTRGWDPVPADGAWLVRNSWFDGTNQYNYRGYFWMSYYEPSLEETMFAVDMEKADNYDNNYQYDGGNYKHDWYTFGDEYLKANVFTVSANEDKYELLKAISFVTYNADKTTYKAEIYTDLTDGSDPTSGTLADTLEGKLKYTGYYTISTSKEIKLAPGSKYAVVVNIYPDEGYDNSEWPYKPGVACECSGYEDNENITIRKSKGESFVKRSGKWKDCYDEMSTSSKGNHRIKAFTVNTDEKYVAPVKPTPPKDTPSDNTPSDNTPSDNTPPGDTPSDNTPSDNTPPGDTPSDNTPPSDTPSDNTPSDNTSPSDDNVRREADNVIVVRQKADVRSKLSGSGAKYRYKSKNKKIARVNKKGIVIGKRPGDVVITLEEKSGKKWTEVSSCELHVVKPVMPKKKEVKKGDNFNVKELISGVEYYPTKWVSSKPSVAKIEEDGTVQILADGKAKIYAIYENSLGNTGKKYKTKIIVE